MRKFTLFLMSLFLTVGAMAQTPVLELTADQIGTTYPKQLSDEDAAKVFALTDLTVAVRVITEGTSGRRGLFVTSDPTLEKNTAAEGTNSRYVAYGLNDQKLSYLASWKTGDRFTANNQTFTANQEITCVYVINPTGGKCELYLDGNLAANWSGTNPNGFMSNYEIATPAMVKAAHTSANIYLGGGMSSAGAGETFGGRILGVKVYSGALSSTEIAAITFEDPALLAQAREAFNTAYTAAQTILNEAELNVTSTELPLQATNESDSYYLWCNKPETSEGSIHALFDGSVGVQGGKTDFFHTNWKGGDNQPRYHYIEVDLGEGNSLSEFSFGYNTRNNNGVDFPDKIYVLGSNDKDGEYTQIYSVESGLPQSAAARWDSEIVTSKTAYRYIRFNVDAERTYWHMSEFDMFTNSYSVAPKYSKVAKEVAVLKNIYDAHASNTNYTTAKLNEAAAAINAIVEAVNAGTVEVEFSYENIDKPTFAKAGNTTKVAMIDFNGQNLSGFTYTQGATEHFNMPQVEAGKTYSLNLTYEMAWGDLAIYQIDKNKTEKKYGYYTCVWEANASPFNILVRDNSDFMCEELGINSLEELEAISTSENTYLTIPYKITIDENLVPGDIVVVRVMVGKSDNDKYNAKNVIEGGCLDLVFTVKASSHTLAVTDAGWATLYLGFNAEIPAGVEAYYVDEINMRGNANMVKIENVIPAETGVIIKAAEGEYTFNYSNENVQAIENNMLRGTLEETLINKEAGCTYYVLGNKDGVGFYNVIHNGVSNQFLNGANKAYLFIASADNTAAFYGFEWEGTTGIENVEVENASNVVYDLTGRRVEAITAPGIYIVNGKKVLVK